MNEEFPHLVPRRVSLEGESAWQAFRASLPRRRGDCPLEADMMDFALGLKAPTEQKTIQRHLEACEWCKRAVDSYQRAAPVAGSLLEAMAHTFSGPPPGQTSAEVPTAISLPPAKPSVPTVSKRNTGVTQDSVRSEEQTRSGLDTVASGESSTTGASEAATRLEPYAAHLLEEAKISRDFASAFFTFLKERQGLRLPLTSSELVDLLRTFASEKVLSPLVLPPQQTGRSLLNRATIRRLLEQEKDPLARDLLQLALNLNQVQPGELNYLRIQDDRFVAAIRPGKLELWRQEIERVLVWVSQDAPVAQETPSH